MRRFNETYALLGTIDPQAAGQTSADTDVIDLSGVSELVFVILTGTVAAGGTVDFDVLTGATTSPATALLDITQLVDEGASQVIISVDQSSIPAGHRYAKGTLARGTANSANAVLVLGRMDNQPASEHNLASVVEAIVN